MLSNTSRFARLRLYYVVLQLEYDLMVVSLIMYFSVNLETFSTTVQSIKLIIHTLQWFLTDRLNTEMDPIMTVMGGGGRQVGDHTTH